MLHHDFKSHWTWHEKMLSDARNSVQSPKSNWLTFTHSNLKLDHLLVFFLVICSSEFVTPVKELKWGTVCLFYITFIVAVKWSLNVSKVYIGGCQTKWNSKEEWTSLSLKSNRYQSSTGRRQEGILAVFQNDKVRNCSSQSTIVPLRWAIDFVPSFSKALDSLWPLVALSLPPLGCGMKGRHHRTSHSNVRPIVQGNTSRDGCPCF